MKIFKIKKCKVWHIADNRDESYCSNAHIHRDWHLKDRDINTVDVKDRDDEVLCNACVGMAYKAGVIEVVDREVSE